MPISSGTHLLYTVRPGDTLYTIAEQLGTNVPSLVQINALYPSVADPDRIYPGQVLIARLPGMAEQSAVLYQVQQGDTLFRIAERFSVSVDMLAGLNQIQQPDVIRVAQMLFVAAFVYEVEQGDSLYRISRRFGTPMSELIRANRNRQGLSPDIIYPGFRLVVPLPSSTNIVVFEPLPSTRIAPGQYLRGSARAFEATINYQIRDAMGRSITTERAATASQGAPAFGVFDVQLQFDQSPATPNGSLMVYTRSARDGSIQDLVEVPVTF
ncbi:LysM peptidoglycan-binding domain-containing protein [Paenibacillus qinlingensis]|uniref:LysM peptidoglycan-binding domain-containing protein n=1 Tax=Paenibacillus qinlingensis TaxID=1837343 RepID=UPI001563B80B|nr:LysM peptidoglycan-binding domain-containing protein [Paenibacillus qinlingensis]NQX58089.1 LysM peptidoglycan-binding domain-containing protein [Paenibacillus qinlingensis]